MTSAQAGWTFGETELVANGQDDDCDGEELCYVNGDGDGFGISATESTTDIACLPANDHASVSGDCCDTDASAFPGQTLYFTTPRSGCGGYDYNCASGNELEPLPHPMVVSTGGTCGLGTCTSTTRTEGWSGSWPTSCGASATYVYPCQMGEVCNPGFGCVPWCFAPNEGYTRGCR